MPKWRRLRLIGHFVLVLGPIEPVFIGIYRHFKISRGIAEGYRVNRLTCKGREQESNIPFALIKENKGKASLK